MDEMKFDQRALDNKRTTLKYVIKNYDSKRQLPPSGLVTFLPENPNELCDRLRLMTQKMKMKKIVIN